METSQNLYKHLPGNLVETCTMYPWEPWKTFSWKPWEQRKNLYPGTLWEHVRCNLRNCVGTFAWEPCGNMPCNPTGTFLIFLDLVGICTWQPWPGNLQNISKPLIKLRTLGNIAGTFTMRTLDAL